MRLPSPNTSMPTPDVRRGWLRHAALRRVAVRLAAQPWLLTLALGAIVIVVGRLGPDWPAQEFRTWLVRHVGLTAWNDQWYGGHALAGYSLLFPLVAAVLGAGLTGLLAATASSWLVTRLLNGSARERHLFGGAAALGLVGNLIVGQVPFLLGLAFGLAAVLAVREQRTTAAAVLAACCSLASPLAGLFLLLAGLAWAFDLGVRRVAPLAAAGAGSLVSMFSGGSGGRFPFPWPTLVGVLVFAILTLLFAPRTHTLLRRFVIIYAVSALAFFLFPNPVGGNVDRLGKLLAVPATAYVLVRHRRQLAVLALALVPAIAWQFVPVTSAVAHGAGDPSRNESYYTGLLAFLAHQNPADGRLEVPFTREHWESALVAPFYPLARGWERQVDLQYNNVLYSPLTPASYHSWLASAAVNLVALADAPLDQGGQAEGRLLAHPPSYLKLVWHDAHWKVWRVSGAQPLATGVGRSLTLATSSFQLNFPVPGDEVVRIRASSLWHVTAGDACIAATPDGWLLVHARSAGEVTARARLTLANLTPGNHDCNNSGS